MLEAWCERACHWGLCTSQNGVFVSYFMWTCSRPCILQSIKTRHWSNLAHISLTSLPANLKAFVPLSAMGSSWQHGYCSKAMCSISISPSEPQEVVTWLGADHTDWAMQATMAHRDRYGMWQSDSHVQSSTDTMWGISHHSWHESSTALPPDKTPFQRSVRISHVTL